MQDDWRPTCSLETLRLRATMLAAVRQFFDSRDYIEVETPLLSHDVVVDAHLDPFEVHDNEETYYLQTSPEAGMKRLLAAGSDSIYQICRSFRQGERGRRHNPEFTMVEWYGVGTTYEEQMILTQELIHFVARTTQKSSVKTNDEQRAAFLERLTADFGRVRYAEAFRRCLGVEVFDAPDDRLLALLPEHAKRSEQSAELTRDEILNVLLAEFVEPKLGVADAEFLLDYPISQAALAQQNSEDPRTASRFELYVDGLELCNGYQELTDAVEMAHRESQQNRIRTDGRSKMLPGAERMTEAMKAGLPVCSGVALGFDRLVMCLAGETDIASVIPFPIERA